MSAVSGVAAGAGEEAVPWQPNEATSSVARMPPATVFRACERRVMRGPKGGFIGVGMLRVVSEAEKTAADCQRVSGKPCRASFSDRSLLIFGMVRRRMSSSAPTFPARFAELVYLLAHQRATAVEQERLLDEAVAGLAAGDASLTTTQLNVDLLDEGQSKDGVRLHELVMRMSAHSAHQIDFPAHTPRAEVLGVARLLADDARPSDDGQQNPNVFRLEDRATTARRSMRS